MEENVHANIQKKTPPVSEGVTSDNVMVEASNLLSEKESKTETQTTRMGPLTFDLDPQLEEDEHVYLNAAVDQAELMQWHHHLGHPSFSRLKQLALNNALPRSSLLPARGAFFGAMTRVPWEG